MNTAPTDPLTRFAPGHADAERIADGALETGAAWTLMTSASDDTLLSADLAHLPPRRRRTRRAVIGLAAASVLGLVMGGATALLPEDGPVPVVAPPIAAAAEIELLAQSADRAAGPQFGEGTYVYRVTDKGGAYQREEWEDIDGNTWVRISDQEVADTLRFKVTLFPNVDAFPDEKPTLEEEFQSPSPAFLATLPTEPNALREALEQAVPFGTTPQRDELDGAVVTRISTILATGYANGTLRAAAYRVLADLPTVEVQENLTSPGGRTGTGVILRGPDVPPLPEQEGVGGRMRSVFKLIVDPQSGEALASCYCSEPLDAGGTPFEDWTEHLQPAQVVAALPAEVRRDAQITSYYKAKLRRAEKYAKVDAEIERERRAAQREKAGARD
jgi:hypothetical protein